MGYYPLFIRHIVSTMFLFALIIMINVIASRAETSSECNPYSEVDLNVGKILNIVQSASSIEFISDLINQIDTKKPLFCEQKKIEESGLVANSFVTNFYGVEMKTYTVLGKNTILTLTFDKGSGYFVARYSGVRTKKTVGDYQLTLPGGNHAR